jgi:putative NADH-flavin reductase
MRSPPPTIALFGGTGRTGQRVLARLQQRGVPTRMLVRQAERLPYALREALGAGALHEGDVRDAEAVAAVLAGTQVAISALGLRDISEPATDVSDGVRTIVGTMPGRGTSRLVAVASAHVLPRAGGGYRGDDAVPAALRHVAAEHVRQYEALRDAPAGIAWTLFCPTFLAADIPAGRARVAADALPPGSDVTGLDDLADALVAEALAPRWTGCRVGIVSDRAT